MSSRILIPVAMGAAGAIAVYFIVRYCRRRKAAKEAANKNRIVNNQSGGQYIDSDFSDSQNYEPSQISHLNRIIDKLIELTSLNASMIAKCEQAQILCASDVAKLDSIPDEQEKNRMFYVLIQRHAEFYQHLLRALQETNQTGAEQLLRNYSEA